MNKNEKLPLLLSALLLCLFSFSQTEDTYTIYMDEETKLLRGIAFHYGVDSVTTIKVGDHYEIYDAKDECICTIKEKDVITIDVSEFWMSTGYYYLVDPDTLKLIRLCPIPSKALKEEK